MHSLLSLLESYISEHEQGMPIRVLGIDLGTTNSTLAEIVYQPGKGNIPQVRCLEIEQETDGGQYHHVLVPSVVAHLGNRHLVGEGPKRLRAHASTNNLEQNRNLFWECK